MWSFSVQMCMHPYEVHLSPLSTIFKHFLTGHLLTLCNHNHSKLKKIMNHWKQPFFFCQFSTIIPVKLLFLGGNQKQQTSGCLFGTDLVLWCQTGLFALYNLGVWIQKRDGNKWSAVRMTCIHSALFCHTRMEITIFFKLSFTESSVEGYTTICW